MFRHEGTNSRGYDSERQLNAIVQLYLEYLVRHPLEPERLAEFNTIPVVAALQFLHKSGLASRVNLEALTSSNEETNKEQRFHKDILFRLLDASVKIRRDNGALTLIEFDEAAAKTAWSNATAEFDSRSLRDIHADTRNLGVTEKLLQRKLTPHEWLSEIDLQRLRKIYGYDPVNLIITKLSAENIGIALHFARINPNRQSPYQVGFILNTGAVGSVMSQGDHWTRMIITIDVNAKKITVQYRDSMRIDQAKRKSIHEAINQGLVYRDDKNGFCSIDSDLTEFDLTVDVAQDVNNQNDPWSCGYRSFAGLILDGLQPQQQKNSYTQLRESLQDKSRFSSETLRDQFFADLFSEVAVDRSALTNQMQTEVVIPDANDPARVRLNPDYISALVANLSQFSQSVVIDNPSLLTLQHEVKINESKQRHVSIFREKLASHLLDDGAKLTIDFDQFIPPSSDDLADQGKLKALFECMRELPNIKKLVFENVYHVMHGNLGQLIKEEFNQLLGVTEIEIKQAARLSEKQKQNLRENRITIRIPARTLIVEFKQTLIPVLARNKLIKLTNKFVEITNKGKQSQPYNSEEDIWMQLCQRRISNPTLFMDKGFVKAQFSLFTNAYFSDKKFLKIQEAMDDCIHDMGAIYLEKLLLFIDANRDFFSTRKAGFPYSILEIGYLEETENTDRSGYLQALVSHLSSRSLSVDAVGESRARYFPFSVISIDLFALEGEDFNSFLLLLEIIAKNYQGVKSISIQFLKDKNNKRYVLTPEQYDQIISMFERLQIQFSFVVSDLASILESRNDLSPQVKAEIHDKQITLYNMAARAARVTTESRLLGSLREVTDEDSKQDDRQSSRSSLITRAYKNREKRFDARSFLAVDVDVQSEIQNQMQLQSQIEQEVQQEFQITSQNEVEIGDSEAFTDSNDNDLVNRTHYTRPENYQSHISSIISSAKSLAFSDRLTSELMITVGQADSKVRTFWSFMLGDGDFRNNIKYISKAAMAKMHALPEYFSYGLNIDNLPVGFYLEKLDNGLVLCFDETKYVENLNESPLTVSLIRSTVRPNWLGDLRVFIPDAKKTYTPSDIENFLGMYKDDKLRLDAVSKDKFIRLMNGIDSDQAADILFVHKWFFDHPAEIELNAPLLAALVDLLYYSGFVGLTILLNNLKSLYAKDKPLFDAFKSTFLDGRENIRSLVEPENIEAINQLADLSYSAKKWWVTLSHPHVKYNQYANLAELYSGFKYFLSKMPSGDHLPLPVPFETESAITGKPVMINMLVYLDRILATLGRVKSRTLPDQLNHLHGLSFDQESAWYAARWDGFRYFHQAMQLNPVGINVSFEEKVLGKTVKTYTVEFADLAKVARCDSVEMDYPAVLFHRYIGRSEFIYPHYTYYVELANSIKQADLAPAFQLRLFALLAVATTGQRGSHGIDPKAFFEFVSAQQTERLLGTLDALIDSIHGWHYQPDIDELLALTQFLTQSKSEQVSQLLVDLAVGGDPLIYRSLVQWVKNDDKITADELVTLFKQITESDQSNSIQVLLFLAKVNGRLSSLPESANTFIESINQVQPDERRRDVWDVLAAIDLDRSSSVPSLAEVSAAIRHVKPNHTAAEVLFVMSAAMPGCALNFNRDQGGHALELSSYKDALSELNQILEDHQVEKIDIQLLRSDSSGQYFQNKIDLLLNSIGPKATLFQGLIYQTALTLLRKLAHTPLEQCIQAWPALSDLEGNLGIFAEPALSGSLSELGHDFVKLNQHSQGVLPVMETLIDLHHKFGQRFKLDFLINSLRARQFSFEQLNSILIALRDRESLFSPEDLLKAIFLGDTLIDLRFAQAITDSVIFLLQCNDMSPSQQTRLLAVAVSHPSDIQTIVSTLREVSQNQPSLTSVCYQIILNAYHHPSDFFDVSALNELLRDKVMDLDVKRILLSRLADYPAYLLNFYDHFISLNPNEKTIFSKIIAYSLLERDNDAKSTIADFYDSIEMVRKLIHANRKNDHNNGMIYLLSLYHTRPYPGLRKLRQYVGLTEESRKSFAQKYHVDPPGLRTSLKSDDEQAKNEERKLVNSQFDRETAHTRIDQIRDLSRVNLDGYENHANQPLYYTHRKNLFNHFLYVNSVGVSFPLSIPGDFENKEACRIPAINLEKNQIQNLIKHYRHIISGKGAAEFDSQQMLAAKLEFVALIREVMYRTTGKFPYSTQIISLLNVMLHGGDIFSEIRTGEGKGSIAALFACFKWAEGNAVDICSSNIELARRDYEEFKDFYAYLGMESNFISAKSSISDYCRDGINYSDMAQLALFQEKMFLRQEDLPDNVACVLDEADFHALDNKSQFRFAANLDEKADIHINPNEWVYPLILEFVQRPEFINKVCSPLQDVLDCRDYIRALPDLSLGSRAKLERYPDALLDKWIDSAYIASRLIEKEDFTVQPGQYVIRGQALSVQIAKVKINHRESPDSTFSDGVHQFLHTRLNMEIDAGVRVGPKFPIEPEKTYLASRSAKNVIDYYRQRGGVLGLTGTVGSNTEIAEMREKYGFKFFRIPPHKPLLRVDHPPVVARVSSIAKLSNLVLDKSDNELKTIAHYNEILKQVKLCQKQGQPVLVICETVESSNALYAFLYEKLSAKNKANLQLFNGEQRDKREKDVVDRAGLAGVVTVTTPMLGRGTDIKPRDLNDNPIIDGLYVIDTFIDPDRDFGQKIGRSGRNGAKGATKLILSEAEFDKHDMPIPSSANKLTAAIQSIRAKMNNESAEQRELREIFADIKDQFFNQYVKNLKHIKHKLFSAFEVLKMAGAGDAWAALSHEMHLKWEAFLINIDKKSKSLLNEHHSRSEAEKVVDRYEELLLRFANSEWLKLIDELELIANYSLEESISHAANASSNESTFMPEPIEFSKMAAKKSEAATPPIDLVPAQLEYAPLDPHRVNVHETYLRISGSTDASVRRKYITKELRIAYEKYFPGVDPRSVHRSKQALANSVGSDSMVEADDLNDEICRAVMRRMLDEYYSLITNPQYAKLPASQLLKTANRLLTAIGRYADDRLKDIVFSMVESELKAYRNNISHLNTLALFLASIKNIDAIKEGKWIDLDRILQGKQAESLDDASVKRQTWSLFRDDLLQQLKRYLSQFGLSVDRKNLAVGIIKRIEELDQQESEPRDKIQSLASLIKQSLSAIVRADYANDSLKMPLSLFSYRDPENSRLWEILSHTNKKLTFYLVNMPETNISLTEEINHLRVLLENLIRRCRLPKLDGHPAIKKIANDVWLSNIIDSIDPLNVVETAKTMALIYARITAYANTFTESPRDNAEKAFLGYLNETLSALRKFKENKYQSELLIPIAQRKDKNVVYVSKEKELFDVMQKNMLHLLDSNDTPIILPVSRDFTSFIGGDEQIDKLARQALVDMIKSIRKVFPQAESSHVLQASLDKENDRLSAVIEYQQSGAAYRVSFQFDSFSLEPEKRQFILCQWPRISDAVAPRIAPKPRKP